jgi:hypothetical protein
MTKKAQWIAIAEAKVRELAISCNIIQRLTDKVNEDNAYEEHTCPNDTPCGICRLVTEAKAFIATNQRKETTWKQKQ